MSKVLYGRTLRHCHVRMIVDRGLYNIYSEKFSATFRESDGTAKITDVDCRTVLIIESDVSVVAKAIRDLEIESDLY